MLRSIRDMVIGALAAALTSAAMAAFVLPDVQGPSLGTPDVNPYTLGLAINRFNQQQTTTGLTALAGGAQTGSTALQYGFNTVATVATPADSVQLPPCNIGALVYVNNAGANATQVFGNSARTDTINGTAGATGVSQAAAAHALYFCSAPDNTTAKTGAWTSVRANS